MSSNGFRYSALLAVSMALSALGLQEATAQSSRSKPPAPCLYEHADFQGREFCSYCAFANVPPDLQQTFSSIRIPDGEYYVEVFDQTEFHGSRIIINQSIADLKRVDGGSWNNRISSFRAVILGVGGCYYGVPVSREHHLN